MLQVATSRSIVFSMKTTRTKKTVKMFAPAAWQWDPASLQVEDGKRIQWWSAGGSCSLISLDEARKLVATRAAFCGSAGHVCQVHDRIDGCNAA